MRRIILILLIFCSLLGHASKPKVALSDLPRIITTLTGQLTAGLLPQKKSAIKVKDTKRFNKIIIA